jgi:hypothetical protein
MARKPPAEIQTMMDQLLKTRATGGGRGRRSPLFRWMFSCADDFRKMLDDVSPSWDAVAAVLPVTDEVKDGENKRPNGERVRKTWFAVRQAKGWDAPKRDKPWDKPPPPASHSPHRTRMWPSWHRPTLKTTRRRATHSDPQKSAEEQPDDGHQAEISCH